MADYRIEITDDEGNELRPLLFAGVDGADQFEALRITAETLGKADNVQRAGLVVGGAPVESVRIIFCRSADEPVQPSGDSLPDGWGDDVPEGNAPVWTSSAPYRGGNRIGDWATAQRIS